MGSASGSGPYQRFPWCLRTLVTTRLRIMVTGGINHAGVLRPATPFYPDGWWGYLKGNGARPGSGIEFEGMVRLSGSRDIDVEGTD